MGNIVRVFQTSLLMCMLCAVPAFAEADSPLMPVKPSGTASAVFSDPSELYDVMAGESAETGIVNILTDYDKLRITMFVEQRPHIPENISDIPDTAAVPSTVRASDAVQPVVAIPVSSSDTYGRKVPASAPAEGVDALINNLRDMGVSSDEMEREIRRAFPASADDIVASRPDIFRKK